MRPFCSIYDFRNVAFLQQHLGHWKGSCGKNQYDGISETRNWWHTPCFVNYNKVYRIIKFKIARGGGVRIGWNPNFIVAVDAGNSDEVPLALYIGLGYLY